MPTEHPTHFSYWENKKPDWSEWRGKKEFELWEACCLACDIDPEIYRPLGIDFFKTLDDLKTHLPPHLRDLIDSAKTCVFAGTLRLKERHKFDVTKSKVDPALFANWLDRSDITPPEKFPWAKADLDPGQYRWPWGHHQTKDLGLLALVADKFWAKYLPEDPSTAPLKKDVVDWLESHGVASRKADVMASILIPPDLPKGPRNS